jgi:hypothetical protein
MSPCLKGAGTLISGTVPHHPVPASIHASPYALGCYYPNLA